MHLAVVLLVISHCLQKKNEKLEYFLFSYHYFITIFNSMMRKIFQHKGLTVCLLKCESFILVIMQLKTVGNLYKIYFIHFIQKN